MLISPIGNCRADKSYTRPLADVCSLLIGDWKANMHVSACEGLITHLLAAQVDRLLDLQFLEFTIY